MKHSSIKRVRPSHPDCRNRSVTGLLCLLRIEALRLVWFEKADGRHSNLMEGFMAVARKSQTEATTAASPSSTPLHIQIPITLQYPEYRSLLPAVSYIEAYPTPAR